MLKELKIKSIKKVDTCEVYDIKNFEKDCYLNEPNFFTNNILVHNCGKHAGGVLILPKPASESIPVIAPQKELASAWQESGAEQDLDNTGYMKYDLLGLNTLDIIDDAINLVNEKMYKIIDDDGIEKIVPESYLKKA